MTIVIVKTLTRRKSRYMYTSHRGARSEGAVRQRRFPRALGFPRRAQSRNALAPAPETGAGPSRRWVTFRTDIAT